MVAGLYWHDGGFVIRTSAAFARWCSAVQLDSSLRSGACEIPVDAIVDADPQLTWSA